MCVPTCCLPGAVPTCRLPSDVCVSFAVSAVPKNTIFIGYYYFAFSRGIQNFDRTVEVKSRNVYV